MRPMSKPKILYTTADASPQSGAFKSLLYMSREIEKWGYQPIRVLHEDAKDSLLSTANGYPQDHFIQLPQPKLGQSPSYYLYYCLHHIPSIYKLVGIIKQERVSLVHINGIFDIYAAVAARIARVPCVWHIRSDLPSVNLFTSTCFGNRVLTRRRSPLSTTQAPTHLSSIRA